MHIYDVSKYLSLSLQLLSRSSDTPRASLPRTERGREKGSNLRFYEINYSSQEIAKVTDKVGRSLMKGF